MSRKIYNRLSFMAVSWLDESTLGAIRRDGDGSVAIGILRDGMESSIVDGNEADLQALWGRADAELISSHNSIPAGERCHAKEVEVAKSGERTGFAGSNVYGLNGAESIADPANNS